jgi:hypothetical protein
MVLYSDDKLVKVDFSEGADLRPASVFCALSTISDSRAYKSSSGPAMPAARACQDLPSQGADLGPALI